MEADRQQAHFNSELDSGLLKLYEMDASSAGFDRAVEDLREKALSTYMESKKMYFAATLCDILNMPDTSPYRRTEAAKNIIIDTVEMGIPGVSTHMRHSIEELRDNGSLFGRTNAREILNRVNRKNNVMRLPAASAHNYSHLMRSA